MRAPTVSFVIPCYNLAEFLPHCVDSILRQTYDDFEVLVMDDCSPDNTADVARSFLDDRVRYIRNDINLGALPNYNKGIHLSRGKYVWLISADDYLRVCYVLERYVKLMEEHPSTGYTFCSAIAVESDKEAGLLRYSIYGRRDRIIPGRVFLKTLLYRNLVVTPTAMARRECYEKCSYFPINPVWAGVPIDLIWAGDWYLWCLFALRYDVGYFAEPMVCYREHERSSTNFVTKEKIENCFQAEAAVPWQIKRAADQLGLPDVSQTCLDAAAFTYAQHLTTKQYRGSTSTVTLEQVEASLRRNSGSEKDRQNVRARTFAHMAELLYQRRDFVSARKYYGAATRLNPWMLKARIKKLLLSLGQAGDPIRRAVRGL